MRVANFRDDVLFPVAHLLGIDPTLDLNKDHARTWVSLINSRVRQAWEGWEWPELNVTEERAFRQVYNTTRQVNLNDEVFYLPTFSYYKAIATPPLGALPTDPTYFEPITLTDYYIELSQPGRRPIDQMWGVWAGNPQVTGAYPPGLCFEPSTKGINIWPNGTGGMSVWINFRVRPPKFSVEEYDATKTYKRGNVIYWSDGDCYEALQTVTGHSPDEPSYWRKVPMPYILTEAVKYAAAADASDDINSIQIWKAEAQEAMMQAINRLGEQGQTYYYQRPRVNGYWSYAPLGAVGGPPWGTDASNTTLTSANDPYAEEADTQMNSGLTQINNGESFVDVDISNSWTGGAAYSFDELVVKNFIDAPPLAIFPTIVVSQRADGFRVLLNSAPDNNNYFLQWRVVI